MNTFSTYTNRRKYFLNTFDRALRNMLVAERVCMVDRNEVRYIDNPYGTAPTTVVQALAGTYAVAASTISDDLLTVSDEFIVAEHIYDFEARLAKFDLMAFRVDEMIASAAQQIDKWVVNNLCEDGTGTLDTPAGGFTTPSNFAVILSGIISKCSGYADAYKGFYVIVENSDLVGIIQAQMNSGFDFADAALNNGLITKQGGVDIIVVRDGTFVDATTTAVSGTKTWTNSGHRVGGVKGVTTYCSPRGITYVEKDVSGKTGKEVEAHGYCGFKAWTPRAALTIDITIVN